MKWVFFQIVTLNLLYYMIDLKNFVAAMASIEEEKGISREAMIETIETALATAYKKEYGERGQVIKARMDIDTGSFVLWQEKTVVDDSMLKSEEDIEEGESRTEQELEEKQEDDREDQDEDTENEEPAKVWFNEERHIMVDEAQKQNKKLQPGDILKIDLDYKDEFGRIAVQTAKQVVIQKIREAERNAVYNEFMEKVDTIISGIVQRVERGYIFFDIGKSTGVMAPKDRIPSEHYRVGVRMRLYLVAVDKGARGPQIIVSRSHPKMLEKLFEVEVPEIGAGSLEIKALAREAGSRSKIAVVSKEPGVDPIGSCVGQGGTRVSAVIQELGGEKIDIIGWSENVDDFIASALSPARVLDVEIQDERAQVVVAEDQLSLAIGRDGQNVRLAAKLTGWKIDIVSKETGKIEESSEETNEDTEEQEDDGVSNETEQDTDSKDEAQGADDETGGEGDTGQDTTKE